MDDFKKIINDILNTEDVTSQMEEQDINNQTNKIFSVVSYLWILFLIPMFLSKDSKFTLFHTNQGIILFAAEIAIAIVCIILGILPVVGGILAGIIGTIGGLATLALTVLGIFNALTGKAKKLPFIGNLFTALK